MEDKEILDYELPARRPATAEDWESTRAVYRKQKDKLLAYHQFVEGMQKGTLKTCYYIQETDPKANQVLVREKDGSHVMTNYTKKLFGELRRGDLVLVYSGMDGTAIVGRCSVPTATGDTFIFERKISPEKIEVQCGDAHGKKILWTSQALADLIAADQVKPGDTLVGLFGPDIAFEAVPKPDGLQRFKFILDEDPPSTTLDDIGSPHPCIEQILQFFRTEMTNPKVNRKYGLRPLDPRLLVGPPGGGKTMATKAIHRGMYDTIKEITGLEFPEIGRRVFKMKASSVISMWLGESEKNFDRFFDEVVEVARTPVKAGKKTVILPVYVIIEEVDAIGRQREGNGHDPMERIMTTALQRFDPIQSDLNCGIIAFNCTTNVPHLLDPAFIRRCGGTVERFGMLTVQSFPKVLDKLLRNLPIASDNGFKQHELRSKVVEKFTDQFYLSDQKHCATISFQGRSEPQHVFVRDLMSAALVDRTVQQAAKMARDEELAGNGEGVSQKHLMAAFKEQVESVLHQMDERNAHKYVELPDGETVTKVVNGMRK